MNLNNIDMNTYRELYYVTYLNEEFEDKERWVRNAESKERAEEIKSWLFEQGYQNVEIHRFITIDEVIG